MSEEEILAEINSITMGQLDEGMSLGEHFEKTLSLYPVEALLFYCDDTQYKKYYYNYDEGMLRYIKLDNAHKTVKEISSDDHLFDAINDEDDSFIPFTSKQVVNKIAAYSDYHKMITYDKTTGHYECFFIDITKEESERLIKQATGMEIFKKTNGIDNGQDTLIEEISEEKFTDAARIIAQWMNETEDISEVKFTKYEDGIKLDIVDSLFYPKDSSEDKEELPPCDSLD